MSQRRQQKPGVILGCCGGGHDTKLRRWEAVGSCPEGSGPTTSAWTPWLFRLQLGTQSRDCTEIL